MQASWMARAGLKPRSRSASSAKSTSMMPFFLTMPISRMMPMKAITVSSMPASRSATSAPSPAEGSVEMMVIGMRQALVQHAQHDVDGEQRRDDEQHLHVGLLLEGAGIAGGVGADGVGHAAARRWPARMASCASCKRHVGGQAVVDGDGRERPLVVDDQRRQRPWLTFTTLSSGTCTPSRPGHEDAREIGRVALERRRRPPGRRGTGCARCRRWRSGAARRRC